MSKLKETLKGIIKKPADKSTFGTNPSDPWSTKAGLSEGALEQYLKAKGINPEFVSRDQKIAHAKSTAFLTWKAHHQFEEIVPESMTTEPSIAHKKKAIAQKSSHAHKEIKSIPGPGFGESKGSQTTQLTPEEVDLEEGAFKRIATDREEDARLKKMSSLDKFRADAGAREKKHAEIAKKSGGMTAAIDRLEKHLNKEEISQKKIDSFHKKLDKLVHSTLGKSSDEKKMKEETEQIDELKDSTLKSYRDKAMASNKNAKKNRDAAEPGKDMSKGFADLHAKANAIVKKRIKGLSGYLQRKHGMKPGYEDQRKTTSEDVGDPKAAVNADGLPNPQLEPVSEKKKQMSKSARMIKALYKKKGVVKEDLYDHEKEDKSVATYGKKPKLDTADKKDSIGEKKPQAAATLSGGKTLTGSERDTVEIDPMMRNRPGQPDITKKDDKKDDKKEDKKKDK